MSRGEIVELDDEGIVMRVSASYGIELCRGEDAFAVYGEEKPSVPKVHKVGSGRKKKLYSSVILTRKTKRKAAMHKGGTKENGVREVEPK